MGGLIDLTGQCFGRLLVVGQEGRADGQVMWKCICDCGVVTRVRGYSLRRGNTRSCGCLRTEMRFKEEGRVGFTSYFHTLKQSAKIRGYEWRLSKEQVRKLIEKECFYCGSLPNQIRGKGRDEYIHNGIDRIDNAVGYVKSNTVSCCRRCNIAKHTLSVGDFKECISRVYHYSIAPLKLSFKVNIVEDDD